MVPVGALLCSVAFTFAFAATAAQASITVSTHKTTDEICTAGVCTPTGPNPNIRVKDLQRLLAHSDIKIVTGQGSTGIGVLDPVTWASSHRLTLDANQSIHIRAPMVVEGTGGVTLTTNDGGAGGDYYFDAPGSLTFWDLSSSLFINGASFTLVKDIATLASDIAANSYGKYALANNYDASADGTYGKAPVETQLAGAFEGLGNTITNLTIVSDQRFSNIGLFSVLNRGGTIRDINLSNSTVAGRGTSEVTGTLVGVNSGTIAAVNANGSVSEGHGLAYVGGLAGLTDGTIANSSFTGKISALMRGTSTGGITGRLDGILLQSSATVDANGEDVGGLVGDLYNNGTITSCHAYGTVSGSADVGGLVGGDVSFGGTITQSFASVSVTTTSRGGGLISFANGTTIAQSYSTGSVTSKIKSKQTIGAFLGSEVGTAVSEAYATGNVNGGASDNVGGFGGACDGGTFSSAYWDITTTKQNTDHCGATGLSDAQLKSGLPVGFDPAVWGQNPNVNNGWPYLLANPPQ